MGVSLNRQISALAADRKATERILQFVQAALEDPSQPSQTVKMQADESYQAVFQRLGQDEYDLTDLVKCLGDFDPVDVNRNFAESSDSLDNCLIASADYQDDTPIVKVKAWFPYRCICRVCRTKKIHRTDRIHSISYNKLYLSFLLY